jgi:ubiquinone/menaquinone biosynthesis C-methylase UbiE
MKVNWLERLIVNSPIRVLIQEKIIIGWIKQKVDLPPGGRFLEIGCGRGAGACMLLKKFQPTAVHALDLDAEMINEAGQYVNATQKQQIKLYVADASCLPYQDASMDAVFGFGVLHHLPDWRGGIKEIARVLKPGGIYFLEEFYPLFYLNFLARRLLAHPEEDRFFSEDLRQALAANDLPLQDAMEIKKLGLLAICRKTLT